MKGKAFFLLNLRDPSYLSIVRYRSSGLSLTFVTVTIHRTQTRLELVRITSKSIPRDLPAGWKQDRTHLAARRPQPTDSCPAGITRRWGRWLESQAMICRSLSTPPLLLHMHDLACSDSITERPGSSISSFGDRFPPVLPHALPHLPPSL